MNKLSTIIFVGTDFRERETKVRGSMRVSEGRKRAQVPSLFGEAALGVGA